MSVTVSFMDENGTILATGQNWQAVPHIGEKIFFKDGFPTMKVFNVVWDISNGFTIVRIYVNR